VRAAIEDMLTTRAHAGLAITDAATGALLGNAGLAVGEPGVGEISYWVAADARGRGAATRAVRLLVDWAWQCGLRRVQLHARVENVGSQRVAEKAGLRRVRV
jgi:RimJ/RimL family protein N-acetyltransferase